MCVCVCVCVCVVESLGCDSEAVSVGFSDTDIPAVHTYHNMIGC